MRPYRLADMFASQFMANLWNAPAIGLWDFHGCGPEHPGRPRVVRVNPVPLYKEGPDYEE